MEEVLHFMSKRRRAISAATLIFRHNLTILSGSQHVLEKIVMKGEGNLSGVPEHQQKAVQETGRG